MKPIGQGKTCGCHQGIWNCLQKYRRISGTFHATRVIENTISTQTMHRIKETKEFKLLVIELHDEFQELPPISMCLAYIDSNYTRKILLIWFWNTLY